MNENLANYIQYMMIYTVHAPLIFNWQNSVCVCVTGNGAVANGS